MQITEFPINIMIEPTNYCNSRCPLCPTGAGILRRAKGFMAWDLFKRLIDEIKVHRSSITLWHYGEPFFHPNTFEFIKYAAENGLPIISSTNGYAFYKKDSIEKLFRSGLSNLIVSLDGASQKVNSQYRVGVDFDRIIDGLKYFTELKNNMPENALIPKLTVQMIAFKHNMSHLESVRNIAKQIGAAFEVKTANLNMVPGINFLSYLPDQDEYRRYEMNSGINEWNHKGMFENKCSFVASGLAINWDGSVNPCCFDYQADYFLGNTNKQSILEIWHDKPLQYLRNEISNNRAGLPICAVCGVDRPQRRLAPKEI